MSIVEMAAKYGEDLFCGKVMPGFGGTEEEWSILALYYGLRSQHQRMVDAFHRQTPGLIWREKPIKSMAEVGVKERMLRAKLIFEEAVRETIGVGLGITVTCNEESVEFQVNGDGDLIEFVDGCFDTAVVVTGSLSQFGIPDGGQIIVNRNNLLKSKRDANGELPAGSYLNADGKFVKSPNHPDPKPEIEAWLDHVSR